jgi:hypothetical protein
MFRGSRAGLGGSGAGLVGSMVEFRRSRTELEGSSSWV